MSLAGSVPLSVSISLKLVITGSIRDSLVSVILVGALICWVSEYFSIISCNLLVRL